MYLEVLNLARVTQNSSTFADIIEVIEEKCLFRVFRYGFCWGFTMVLKLISSSCCLMFLKVARVLGFSCSATLLSRTRDSGGSDFRFVY